MKRHQLNLALLVIAVALGVAVYFSQEKEEKGPPLTPLTAETIDKVRIEHPDAPAIALEKSGAKWVMTEPVNAPVDSIEINGVLNLATLEVKSTLEATDLQPAELGLEPPRYTVTFNDQKIEVGNTEPLNYRRYLRAGGKIMLTDDPPSAALDADYSDLVSKQLLPEDAEIVGLKLPGLTLARSADGTGWELTPADPEAGADRKQKLVDAWLRARAMWNAAQNDGPLKGEPVTVTLKDGTVDFIIAERDPQLVLVRPDLKVRFTLSKALIEELLQLPPPPKEDAPEASAAATAADASE
jgi:hypothetical protein